MGGSVERFWLTPDGQHWTRSGRPSIAAANRDALVRGAYIPSDATAGPTVSSWTSQEANAAGTISLTTPNLDCIETTHWGDVRHQAPGIHHFGCRVAGPDPNLMYAGTYGASGGGQLVRSYGGSSYYHWWGQDMLFDPWLWYTERGRTPMTDATFVGIDGISGGDCTVKHSIIRHVVDGLHFMHQENNASDTGNTGWSEGDFVAPAGERYCILDRVLVEKGIYVAGDTYRARPGAQSDGRPHGDGAQLMQGRNVWITGTMIGGDRDSVGYTTWPNTGNPGNTGDDYSNSCLQIKQEGTYSAGDVPWLTNVLIEDGFLAGGGGFCVNFAVASDNNLAGVTIRNMKLAQRQYGDGLGVDTNGTPTSVGSGYGYYRNSVQASTWSGNSVLETGASIPTGTNQVQ